MTDEVELGRSVRARRALEALRAGVPNRDAVTELGSMQVGIEDRFAGLLDAVRAAPRGASDAVHAESARSKAGEKGFLLGGGFGTGKSHVLEHLAHLALSEHFVVSKVTVSKETPLYDPAKVYRAAIDDAQVPGRPGSAIDEIAAALSFDSPGYRDLWRWVHGDSAPVDKQFAATLYLFEYARGDNELFDRILRFWAGDRLPVADIRRRLREQGAGSSYRIAAAREADLSRQRFRFLSRLARAAGYSGWVVLIDEVELIGRYSIGQRTKSYGELARWVRGDRDDPGVPLGAVLATVDDFEAEVLVGKHDLELVPSRLRSKGGAEEDALAALAEAGMRVMAHDQLKLQPPGTDELNRTYARLREVHADAFGWDPPDVPGLERLPSNRMRQYVRAWINEWDLRRLYPGYEPDILSATIAIDLSDDSGLEAGREADEDEGDSEPGTDESRDTASDRGDGEGTAIG